MRILIIGGMHGNEPLGIELVELLKAKPIRGVDAVFANPRAVARNCRFINSDLNRSFPGDKQSKEYESYRASELIELAQAYDLVLDFHNTHCPNNDCCFVGEAAKSKLTDIAAWFGLSRIIVADYDCVNKYAPNCLSIEISLDSQMRDASFWYRKIQQLSVLNSVPVALKVKKFRFVYRITLEDKERLRLTEQNLVAFLPIKSKLADAMGVESPAYPIFVNDIYTPYNYGGLLNKINV